MSTYLPGVTDLIPQIQPFKPDLNFYGSALQTLDTKYDTNYKQLSKYYGQLLKSPLLRDDNIQRRDTFFKAIDQDIKKISGMDLSLQQNVDQAVRVLDPLVEDRYIINDMVKTRQWQNNQDIADTLKDTDDGWEGASQILDYWAQDFRKVSSEDALNMKGSEFIPYVNVEKLAMDDAKAMGFKVTMDDVSGRWLVRNVNGDLLAGNLREYFVGRFGRDPKVMKYIQAETYLERKNWVSANLPFYSNNEQLAQQAYARNKMNESVKAVKSAKMRSDEKKDMINKYLAVYKEFVETNGVLPSDKETINQGKALMQSKQNIDATGQVIDQQDNTLNNYMKDYASFIASGDKLDQIMSYSNMYKLFDHAAKSYANMTAERTIQGANPYALEGVKHANQMNIEQFRLQGDLTKIQLKGELDAKAERIKQGLDVSNIYPVTNVPGGSTPLTSNGIKENARFSNQFFAEGSAVKSAFLYDYANDLIAAHGTYTGDDNKRGVIRDNMINVYRQLGIDANKLLDPATQKQELNKIRNLDATNNLKLYAAYNMAAGQLDQAVNQTWGAGALKDKYQYVMNDIQIKDEAQKAYTAQQMDNLKSVIIPYFTQGPEAMKNDPTGIVGSILSESTNGFFPTDARKEEVARKLAANNARVLGANNPYTEQYYLDNWEQAKSVWNQSMSKIPYVKAYNHIDGTGQSSNAFAGQGATGNFNFSNMQPGSSTSYAESIIGDIIPALEEMSEGVGGQSIKVDYGDGTVIPGGSDPNALRELKVILGDRFGRKLKGNYVFQPIIGGDPNYMGFKITPSQEDVEKYKSYKDQPGALSGETITVYLPTNNLRNIPYNEARMSTTDWAYQNNNQVVIGNDRMGKATIRKTSSGPEATFDINVYDAQTRSMVRRRFVENYTADHDIDGIRVTYEEAIKKINQFNNQMKLEQSQLYGEKDIQKLFDQ